ncbi:T9SS type A sorting domain-containing protein, partial [Cryomorphaceae bacterium 1068]|nr:T9SS type A sorting domain-containing protein [Cryomorphaceae bacterium 1068]
AIMKDSLRFKQWILVFSMVMVIAITSAQNLIPNGGFEEGITCPSFVGNVTEECANWYGSLISDGDEEDPTPDWFHTCSEFETLTPPNIGFGNQTLLEGEAYTGVATFLSNIPEYREIIGVELIEPLILGETYTIEFYISDVFNEVNSIFTSHFGYTFSTHPFYYTSEFPTNFSHFFIDTVITSSNTWTHVVSEFTADSTYSYFHLGNFYADENIDTLESGNSAGYYVVDNISVIHNSVNGFSTEKYYNINVYPNPTSDQIIITNPSYKKDSKIYIYTSDGQLMRTIENSIDSPRIIIDISTLPYGIYYIHYVTPKSIYNAKFIKI